MITFPPSTNPKHAEVSMKDAGMPNWHEVWVQRLVDRAFDSVHTARVNARWSGAASDEDCEPGTIRRDLLAEFRQRLAEPMPNEIISILERIKDTGHRGEEGPNREATRKELIEQWNRYWDDNYVRRRQLPPSFGGVNFQSMELSGIELRNADLQRPHGRIKEHSDHQYVNLSKARLEGANLSECDLRSAKLDGADFTNASLAGASLVGSSMRGAKLHGADLRNAFLQEVDFTGADLSGADFTGANLNRANLDEATILNTSGLLLDMNSVYRTKFSKRPALGARLIILLVAAFRWINQRYPIVGKHTLGPAMPPPDLWSSLRHAYTGPNFFISLLFLATFTIPYVIQAVVLTELGRAEGAILRTVSVISGEDLSKIQVAPEETAKLRHEIPGSMASLRVELTESSRLTQEVALQAGLLAASGDMSAAEALATVSAEAARQAAKLEQRIDQIRSDTGKLAVGTVSERRFPIWQYLLGIDSGHYGWTLLLIVLMIYNGLKWFLTTEVAPMRDAEDRSHIAPARIEYVYLLWPHRAVEWLFWVSLASGAYTLTQWMASPVYKFW